MTPIKGSQPSLTKHYNIATLASTIAGFSAGMSQNAVEAALPPPHVELADDLFVYDRSGLAVDTLVAACQASDPAAQLLVWTALLLADDRLQDIVTNDLTTPDGKLDPTAFTKASLSSVTASKVGGASHEKAASNILQWFNTAGIVRPTKHGGSVTGIDAEHPTSFAVPKVLSLLRERLSLKGVTPSPGLNGIVDLGLGVGVNHWLNLTPADFRAAAHPPTPAAAKHTRSARPPDLEHIDSELRRKRQAIVQGPPGVGKTYTVEDYLKWFAPGDARLTSVAMMLPEHEREPPLIADRIQTLGLPAVWDVVQFHPSYSYERFVRGLQPTPVPGGVTFRPVNRLLGLIAQVASELDHRDDDVEFLLVVDEINRGDIAKVFGELLYALEYRGQPISTPYPIDGDPTLILPPNLFLLGTMNTADQSIAMVDKALRRRFAWITLHPDPTVIDSASTFFGADDRAAAKQLFADVATLFSAGGPEYSRLQLGHSYFLPTKKHDSEGDSIDAIATQFAHDAWPLLEEYEAEGLLEPEQLNALLNTVGWSDGERPKHQRDLAVAVANHLKKPPPAASP